MQSSILKSQISQADKQKKKEMDEARTEVRKKQDELHLKQLEFKLIEEMDMKQINTMLLDRNTVVFQQIKELYDDGNVKEPEIYLDFNQIHQRKSRMENYGKRYVEQSKNIYKKLNLSEIKELVDKFNQNTRLMDSKQVDNFQRLYMEYYKTYSGFLQAQPEVEHHRRQLIQELGEVHELMSVLNNAPTFEEPAIWNKTPLPEDDKKVVDDIVDKSIRQIKNKYDFSVYDLKSDDILTEVKEYMNTKYYKVYQQ